MKAATTPTWDVLAVRLLKARAKARKEAQTLGAAKASTLMLIDELLAETQTVIAIDDAKAAARAAP